MLRRTIVRPAGTNPDPIDSAYVADRLTGLTHELANLLDGSMRCLSQARRTLGDPSRGAAGGTGGSGAAYEGANDPPVSLIELARHLDTVHHAMQQMAELVRASGGALGGIGEPRYGCGAAGPLADAVRHAVDVMAPVANDHRIRLSADIGPELEALRAGSVYAIITSGVRNSIEAIQRLGATDGTIDVVARVEAGRTGTCVLLEILDDGEGPPTNIALKATANPRGPTDHVFRLGFTTKPGGQGVGLSVARELVDDLGGTIELLPRAPDPLTGRAGAVLRVRFPCPAPAQADSVIGNR